MTEELILTTSGLSVMEGRRTKDERFSFKQ